jgi:hypothetical protein
MCVFVMRCLFKAQATKHDEGSERLGRNAEKVKFTSICLIFEKGRNSNEHMNKTKDERTRTRTDGVLARPVYHLGVNTSYKHGCCDENEPG